MKIKVRIDFAQTVSGSYAFDAQDAPNTINVNGMLSSKRLEEGSNGYKGFQLSASKDKVVSSLDGGYGLFSAVTEYSEDLQSDVTTVVGYPGYISRQLSQPDGSLSPALDIKFTNNGAAHTSVWLGFDSVSREYATDFTLRNITKNTEAIVTNNTSVLVEVPLIVDANDVLILSVSKWSKGNASVKVTRIAPHFVATYYGSDLVEVVCSENAFDSDLSIKPGICEQYADITLYDRNGMIHLFALQGKLQEDYSVEIYYIDYHDAEILIGTYKVTDWNVLSNNSRIDVSCSDFTSILDNINISAIGIKTRTVDDMLKLVFGQLPITAWKYDKVSTQYICEDIIVPNSWFYACTAREMLEKICTLGLLRIYWHNNIFIVRRCWI